jgi:hypothetical protein
MTFSHVSLLGNGLKEIRVQNCPSDNLWNLKLLHLNFAPTNHGHWNYQMLALSLGKAPLLGSLTS